MAERAMILASDRSKLLGFALILLLMTPIFTALKPYASASDLERIEWLTFWCSPKELWYWSNVTAAYEAETGVKIQMIGVEFDDLESMIKGPIHWTAGEYPDMAYIHEMWIPTLANWKRHMLAVPPPDAQADIRANWSSVTVEGSTYKGIAWGYPGEFNSWALVYNKKLFQNEISSRAGTPEATFLNDTINKLEADQPLNWTEFTDAAILLAKWEGSRITQWGFIPFIEGMPEEQRSQFLSLLWSNGGEYLDLLAPEAKFNGTEGKEVMQLYYDLGFVHKVYDPIRLAGPWPPGPPYWGDGWVQETIAMMILPTWMDYILDVMGANFVHLGVAPTPIGPHGTESISVTYNFLNVVTQKAEEEGKAEAAWEFLEWINEPKPAGYITIPSIGDIPKHNGTSIMGDFLISERVTPSRISDQTDPTLLADFWKSEFIKFGSPPYGRGDKPFLKGEEVEHEIGQMFEKVTLWGEDPTTTVRDTAAKVQALLPMPGDINIDGIVDIFDAVHMIKDIDANPGWGAAWYRGRSDINDDLRVSGTDVTILSVNYGKKGDP